MYKSIIEQYINYFNDGDLKNVMKLFHKDSQLIRLMTNDILYDGIDKMSEMHNYYINEAKVKMKLYNMLEFNNIIIMFLEVVGMNAERIVVVEFVDDKIRRTWASQFNKEEE